ncbi:MAG TPA: tetratricopeptide repeat protein [Thermoanaerobaculia bacterium]|nr:tetratricopeptide repeat protein [Thermoanaerobaculia bacterium]
MPSKPGAPRSPASVDACALLLTIAPRIGGVAGEIARLCDGLPIALRLAGGALAERTDLTPDSYLRRLAGEKERLGLIDGSLKLSVQLLLEELKDLWCKLAVFPASFDAAAAAAVWGLQLDPALDSLGTLMKSSLVDGEDGRYRLHDLARLFADSQLAEAGRKESWARHAEHYFQVVAAAGDLYKKGGDALLAGLRLFDSEWANIQVGQRWAAAQAGQERRAAELARDFPARGAYILDLRQSPRELISWLQAALEASRRLEDRRAEGAALGNMGLVYADLGEPRRAIELYEQSLPIAREIGDRRGEGNSLGSMGMAYADLGESRRAIEFHEQYLAIAREIGDRRGEGNALGSMGVAYAVLGEPRRAIEVHEQHLAIAREIGDRRGEAYASWNLGLELEKQGELARAVQLMQVCVDYERGLGHPKAEAGAAYVQAIRARLGAGEA